jgi:hypothetical protein
MRRAGWGVLLLALVAGCSPAPEKQPGAATESASALVVATSRLTVVPVRHSYFPRRDDVDYWETIPRTHSDPEFFLQVHPRIKTPAEGPWIATFTDAAGDVLTRLPGLRVDVATGNFLFLCSRREFAPGDWTLALEVMEGGLEGIEPQQTFRFRVE